MSPHAGWRSLPATTTTASLARCVYGTSTPAGARALLLGPLAVDQTAQGEGIGASLMRLAIARAGMIGHKGIILVGDPEYYERFGFTADRTSGLLMPGPVDRRRFLSLELERGLLNGAEGRIVATGATVAMARLAA